MFYGTKLFYKLLYFITAMTPAYILFLLQINYKFENEVDVIISKIQFDAYKMVYALIIITIILTMVLKFLLKRQFEYGRGNTLTKEELKDFTIGNIEEYNGSILSFLLGTVIPAVLIIETSMKEAIIVFLVLQIIIFVLISRSSEIFPNLVLIILGVDICKMTNGKYLLLLNQKDGEITKVIQLGNPNKSKLFITSIKK